MVPPVVSIRGDVLIRTLDYVNRDTFNGSKMEINGYTAPDLVNGCIVRTHKWEGKKLETCAATETESIDTFFNRHKSYQKYFIEETAAAALNSWTTEFHLFFYDLDSHSGCEDRAQSRVRQAKALTMPAAGSRGSKESELTRVVMSFQFEGDFWDRYWTCRVLEADKPTARKYREAASKVWNHASKGYKRAYFQAARSAKRTFIGDYPKVSGTEWIMSYRWRVDLMDAFNFDQTPWQQRRVLELLLFEKIIRRMHEGANNILTQAWLCMRRKEESTQNEGIPEEETEEPDYDALDITTDSYFVTTKLIKQVQQILQLVEGDLEENIAQIVQWGNREKDRDAEKPRWTYHDESRYRATIKKLLASNERAVQRIRRTHLKVSKFEALLAKTLETLRSDLDERRAGDIQRFTYVTVVFLPLGFAIGVFSMSEAPRLETLRSMIITAVVALTITAFSLFAAKLADDAGLLKLPAFIHRVWDMLVQSRRFAGVMQPEPEKNGALGVKGRLESSEGEAWTESKDDGTVLSNEPNAIGSARWFPITIWRRKNDRMVRKVKRKWAIWRAVLSRLEYVRRTFLCN